jgi:molecular chaperone GrpE
MTEPHTQPDTPEETPETGNQFAPPQEHSQTAADTARVGELEAALTEAQDKLMRALAEAENTRRRAIKEREDAGKYAVQSFAKDLLDFSGNFGRALAAIPDDLKGTDPRVDNVLEGIGAMERELMKVFDRHGIQKIEPLDQPFDPNFHEVMFEAPMPGKPNGTVIQVIEAGYTLSGRLLRAAKVGIAKNADGDSAHHVDQQA